MIASMVLAGCNNGSDKPEYIPDPGEPTEPTPDNPKGDRVDVLPLIVDGEEGTGVGNPINSSPTDFYPSGVAAGASFEDETCSLAKAPTYCFKNGASYYNQLRSVPVIKEDLWVYDHLQDLKELRVITYENHDSTDSLFSDDHTMLNYLFSGLAKDVDSNNGLTRLSSFLGLSQIDELMTIGDVGSDHINALIALEYLNYRDNDVQPVLLSSELYDAFPSDALDSYEKLNSAINIALSSFDNESISNLIDAVQKSHKENSQLFSEVTENEALKAIFPSQESLEALANTYSRLLEDGSFFTEQYPKLEISGYRLSVDDNDVPESYVTTKYINVGKFSDSSQLISSDKLITHRMTQNYIAQFAFLNSVYDWNEDWGANFSIEDLRDGKYRAIYHGFSQYFANQNFADPSTDNKCNPFATEKGDCSFPNNYGSYGLLYEVMMSGDSGTPAEATSALSNLLSNLKATAYGDCSIEPLENETSADACIRGAFDSAGFVDSLGNPITIKNIQDNWEQIKGDYVNSNKSSDSLGSGIF